MAGTNAQCAGSWVFERNKIYNNNLVNTAPPGTFQASLPSGRLGVFIVGTDDITMRDNDIFSNDFVGIAVVGFCTALQLAFPFNCDDPQGQPVNGDPSTNFNIFLKNRLSTNGANPNPLLGLPGVNIHAQDPAEFVLPGEEEQNCFENNVSTLTILSLTADMQLPTEGCE